MTELNVAYDQAVLDGYKGSRREWLASVRRKKENSWQSNTLKVLETIFTIAVCILIVYGICYMWLTGLDAGWSTYVTNGYKVSYSLTGQFTFMVINTWAVGSVVLHYGNKLKNKST